MKTVIGIILLLVGIYAGYEGYKQVSGSTADVKIGDIEISASDQESKTQGYLLLGAGVIGVVAGFYFIGKKDS
jgi:CHASE3 domain sensor protein